MISQELTKEFQQIIKEEAGEQLSLEDAKRLGTYLVEYFQILIKIDEDGKKKR
jgi:hypothetical protein